MGSESLLRLGAQRDDHATLSLPLLQVAPQRLDERSIGTKGGAQAKNAFPDVGIGATCGLGELIELSDGAVGLPATKQRLCRLGLGVDVAQDLGDAVVHLAGN